MGWMAFNKATEFPTCTTFCKAMKEEWDGCRCKAIFKKQRRMNELYTK
jgi:hypothetical protein